MDEINTEQAVELIGEGDLRPTLEALWAHPQENVRAESVDYFVQDGMTEVYGTLDTAAELGMAKRYGGVSDGDDIDRYELTEFGKEVLDELVDHSVSEEVKETSIETFMRDDRYDSRTEPGVVRYLSSE